MNSSRLRRVAMITVIAAALAVSWSLAAAPQEPTFKGENRTVAVYATVTDLDGRLVPDLNRDRFTVLDDGKPQPLTFFANDIQPITVAMLLDRSGSMRRNY